MVSTKLPAVSWEPLVPCMICCVCRMTNVNLNVRSSSLFSLSMKLGFPPGEGSGSWHCQHRDHQKRGEDGRHLSSYLDIFDHTAVSKVARRGDPCCRKLVWDYIEHGPTSRIGDREGRYGYCSGTGISCHPLPNGKYMHAHRVWSLRYSAAPSSGLLLTFPIFNLQITPPRRSMRGLRELGTLAARMRSSAVEMMINSI